MISLNVRGIGNFRKRRAMFTWCRKQKADVIFLQETHSTKNCESQWKKEWDSLISFSHGTSNARGLAVLFKSKLDIVILQELFDSKGRLLVLNVNSIESIQSEFSLHDVWRVKNPNTRSFTWSKMSPFIFCRLDYWLISDSLHDLVSQVDI